MVAVALGIVSVIPASAQYPGQITKNSKDAPELRAIAVLEWTGDAGKPKTSRLVPVAVLDGGTLQDGGIYLARPEPLALAGEVEYELDEDGKPMGLFDIKNAGQEQGSWVGYGWWKAMPVERPKRPALDMAKFDDDAQSDVPMLHRKHHADDAPSTGGTSGNSGSASGSSGGSGSSAPAADSDPDRPTLHRSPSSGSSDAGTTPASTTTGTTSSSSEPTLHRKDSDSTGSGNGSDRSASSGSSSGGSASETSSATAPDDPDRPVMKRSKPKPPEEVAHVDSVPDDADPDRPRLKRGRSNADSLQVTASLMGLPPDMQQAVAVSDAKTHPAHPWDYQWSNPDDATKMQSALEDIARKALGLNPPAAQPAPKKAATAKAGTRKTARPAAATPPLEPAPLQDEKFRIFELSYGAGATLVLTAHTDGPLAQEKFVTLVAQPDLYGNVLVLLKSVTDGAHLDDTPRMRLVDAVDALADNRGELLFELRGATQRQFALYRVLRGQAEKLFVSSGGDLGVQSE